MNTFKPKQITVAYFSVTIERGGAENLLLRLCSEFSKTNKDVTTKVVAFKQNDNDLLQEFSEINIPVSYLNIQSNLFKFYDFIKIIRWLKENKPEIVHTHAGAKMDKFILFAAALCGIRKRFCTIHNMDQSTGLKARLSYKLISLLSNKLIAVSEGAKTFYSTNNFFSKSKLIVITNCPGFQAKYINQRDTGLKNKKNISIINIGGLRPQKGQIYLIRALDLLRSSPYNFQLKIIGDDRFGYGSTLINEVSALKLSNVSFPGNLKNIESELNSADILVASSIKEAFHIVVVEAMSVGLPVVATNILPHKEIFKPLSEAILVNVKDPNALAEGILKLVEDEDLYIRLSKKEIIRAKDYSVTNAVTKHLNLYTGSN